MPIDKVTKIFFIDWSSIINVNRLIDIDCHRFISILIDHRFHRLVTPGPFTSIQIRLMYSISITYSTALNYLPITRLGRGKTSSLLKWFAANSPRWDEFLNLVLDGCDRTPGQTRRGIPP